MKDSDMAQPEEKKEGKIEQYEIESAFRSIMEAEKVKKNPKLMAAVKKHAEEAMGAITGSKSIEELKELRSKRSEEKREK